MDFYNQLLAQKLSGGGGGGDKYAAFKALVDDSLTEVTAEMLDGATKISSYVFYYCQNLTSVEIPNSVTIIGDFAFYMCTNLTNINMTNNITEIGQSAFYKCVFTTIEIPSSVTLVKTEAFRYCTSLESVTIKSGAIEFWSSVFALCGNLKSVTVESINPPTVGSQLFGASPPTNLVIYVPAESVDIYKAASGWSPYAARIQAIPSD